MFPLSKSSWQIRWRNNSNACLTTTPLLALQPIWTRILKTSSFLEEHLPHDFSRCGRTICKMNCSLCSLHRSAVLFISWMNLSGSSKKDSTDHCWNSLSPKMHKKSFLFSNCSVSNWMVGVLKFFGSILQTSNNAMQQQLHYGVMILTFTFLQWCTLKLKKLTDKQSNTSYLSQPWTKVL